VSRSLSSTGSSSSKADSYVELTNTLWTIMGGLFGNPSPLYQSSRACHTSDRFDVFCLVPFTQSHCL
jgi:hypothetical protein